MEQKQAEKDVLKEDQVEENSKIEDKSAQYAYYHDSETKKKVDVSKLAKETEKARKAKKIRKAREKSKKEEETR